jgi:hypothetical protein
LRCNGALADEKQNQGYKQGIAPHSFTPLSGVN